MAKSAEHVAAQKTEWTVLRAHAAAGELTFEPGAAEQCAAALDKLYDHMEDQLQASQRLFNVDGFGDTIVGKALAGKFSAQAEDAVKVLKAHQALLTDMAWTFRQAGKNYTATNEANAQNIKAAE